MKRGRGVGRRGMKTGQLQWTFISSLQCCFSRPPASEIPVANKMQIPPPTPDPLIFTSWGWVAGICILNKFLRTLMFWGKHFQNVNANLIYRDTNLMFQISLSFGYNFGNGILSLKHCLVEKGHLESRTWAAAQAGCLCGERSFHGKRGCVCY